MVNDARSGFMGFSFGAVDWPFEQSFGDGTYSGHLMQRWEHKNSG